MSTAKRFNQAIVLQSANTIGTMFLTNGNVGINNPNPSFTLDVSGGISISGGSLSAPSNTNTVGSLFTTGGNVGINTVSPAYRLDVTGNCRSILTGGAALMVGGPSATYDPCIIILNSQGSLQIGIASGTGSYSTNAFIGDGVIRSAPGDRLHLQTGSGESHLCLTTNGNVGIVTTSQNTRLSITPRTVESKITLFQHPTSGSHYGFGVSSLQLNYHVPGTVDDHVFWYNGKNGNGTELLRIKGNGLMISPNFTTTTVYTNMNVDWNNVNSSTFTVGSGTKMLTANFSWWTVSANVRRTVYFDIYTSTNTLVTTLSQLFFFNQGSMHTAGMFTDLISSATMGAGTYYIKFRHDSITDANDYMRVYLITFPF